MANKTKEKQGIAEKNISTNSAGGSLQGLPPVVNAHTQLIILGSFPGEASLLKQQYYAHPRNQFWPLLSGLLGTDLLSLAYTERIQAILDYGLGLWDIYATCQRKGSLDSAITQAIMNPLDQLRQYAPSLQAVAHNGGLSWRAAKYTEALGVAVYRLPSSSPANAQWSFEQKRQAWHAVFARHL